MGRLTTTPGMWVLRGVGIWLLTGIVGAILAVAVDGRTLSDDVAQSPLAQLLGVIGLVALVLCLVAAAVAWNWDLRPDQPAEPRRAATEGEKYDGLYAAADELERRKANRRR